MAKPLEGKIHRIECAIKKLKHYCCLAIRRNVNNLEVIKTVGLDIFSHEFSTCDRHQQVDDDGCKISVPAYEHNNSLPTIITDEVISAFMDLTVLRLVKTFLDRKSQKSKQIFKI
jgi:hypothetical protein